MRKRKILLVILSIILIMMLIMMGCDAKEVQVSAYSDNERLVTAHKLVTNSFWADDVEGQLVVDTQTGVEYWYIAPKSDNGGYSLTLLVDKEGKPLIWKGE